MMPSGQFDDANLVHMPHHPSLVAGVTLRPVRVCVSISNKPTRSNFVSCNKFPFCIKSNYGRHIPRAILLLSWRIEFLPLFHFFWNPLAHVSCITRDGERKEKKRFINSTTSLKRSNHQLQIPSIMRPQDLYLLLLLLLRLLPFTHMNLVT